MKHTINVSILESVKKDIYMVQDLLKLWQKQTDFHADAANRAERLCDMALSKIETVLPNERQPCETNNAD